MYPFAGLKLEFSYESGNCSYGVDPSSNDVGFCELELNIAMINVNANVSTTINSTIFSFRISFIICLSVLFTQKSVQRIAEQTCDFFCFLNYFLRSPS